jgi:hypothetical protein
VVPGGGSGNGKKRKSSASERRNGKSGERRNEKKPPLFFACMTFDRKKEKENMFPLFSKALLVAIFLLYQIYEFRLSVSIFFSPSSIFGARQFV